MWASVGLLYSVVYRSSAVLQTVVSRKFTFDSEVSWVNLKVAGIEVKDEFG